MFDDLKILIAEDQALTALDLKYTLREFGFSDIIIARNGNEAVTEFKAKKPDIVLLDIMMEHGIDGIDAANEIKSFNKNVPILFLTGSSDQKTYNEASKSLPVEIIIKPYSIQILYKGLLKAAKFIKRKIRKN